MRPKNHQTAKFALYMAIFIILASFILMDISAVFPTTSLPESYTWTEMKYTGTPLDQSQKQMLLDYAVSRLSSSGKAPATLPALQPATTGRIIFVSVSDGQKPALVTRGKGRDLFAALDSALIALANAGEKIPEPEWIKIDVVNEIRVRSRSPVT